jgi:hypothetical protein
VADVARGEDVSALLPERARAVVRASS